MEDKVREPRMSAVHHYEEPSGAFATCAALCDEARQAREPAQRLF